MDHKLDIAKLLELANQYSSNTLLFKPKGDSFEQVMWFLLPVDYPVFAVPLQVHGLPVFTICPNSPELKEIGFTTSTCPICEYVKANSNDENIRKMKSKLRFYSIITLDNQKLMLYGFPNSLFQALVQLIKVGGDFTDFGTGYPVLVVRQKLNNDYNYNVFKTNNNTPPADLKPKIYPMLQGYIKSVDQLKKVMSDNVSTLSTTKDSEVFIPKVPTAPNVGGPTTTIPNIGGPTLSTTPDQPNIANLNAIVEQIKRIASGNQ